MLIRKIKELFSLTKRVEELENKIHELETYNVNDQFSKVVLSREPNNDTSSFIDKANRYIDKHKRTSIYENLIFKATVREELDLEYLQVYYKSRGFEFIRGKRVFEIKW